MQPVRDLLLAVVRNDPDVGVAAAKEREQFAAIAGANAARMPTLDLSASAGPQHTVYTDPEGTAARREVALTVRQTIYDFGATSSDVRRAKISYESAARSRIAKTEQFAFDLLTDLTKVRQLDELVALTKKNIEAHNNILKIVQTNETNGNSTIAAVKRVTTRLETAKSNLIDQMTSRSNAADSFRRLAQTLPETVDDSSIRRLGFGPATFDQDQLDKNPEVVAIQLEIDALRQQLKSTEASGLPTIDLSGTVKSSRNANDPGTSDRDMSANMLVSVRIPLLDGGANRSLRDQVSARLQGAYLRLEKRKRELREDAEGVQRVTASDGDKMGTLNVRVAAAQKVADLYLEQFRNGSSTVFEILDAQGDLMKAQTELVDQTYNRRRAAIRGLFVKGELVNTILAQP